MLRKFWAGNGPQLSEHGRRKLVELKTAMEITEKDFQAAHDVLSEAISQRVRAVNAIDAWMRTVTVRREAAREAEEAKTAAKPLTLTDRLRSLGQKLTT